MTDMDEFTVAILSGDYSRLSVDTIYGTADSDASATDENELATTNTTTDAAVGSTGPPSGDSEPSPDELLIKVREVGLILRLDKKRIRDLADSGDLPSQRLGPRQDRYFRREDVLAFRDHVTHGRWPSRQVVPPVAPRIEPKPAEPVPDLTETVQKLATYVLKLEEQLKKVDIRVHSLETELQRRPNVTQLVEWKPNHRRVSEGGRRVKEQRKGVRFGEVKR